MIHRTLEGDHPEIGLNITTSFNWRRPWIVLRWVWYTPKTRTMTSRRIRIRLFMRPFIITSKDSFDVVHGYLWENELELVHREVLQDLKDAEESQMKRYDHLAYIKPL